MKKTTVAVIHPIISALVKAWEVLGKNFDFQGINDYQNYFLKNFFSTQKDIQLFSEKELQSWASMKADILNKILRQRGFDIQLREFDSQTFGVVSILDILAEWLVEGKEDLVCCNRNQYPAVKMDSVGIVDNSHEELFNVYNSTSHEYPIVMIKTESGDQVYMTIAGNVENIQNEFQLIHKIQTIHQNKRINKLHGYRFAKFPMVNIDQRRKLNWLLGMKAKEDWFISQALQQTIFKMNQFGARVKSAVAVAVTRSAELPKGLEINRPFFLWIARKDVRLPIVSAYITPEDWKNPGNLV